MTFDQQINQAYLHLVDWHYRFRSTFNNIPPSATNPADGTPTTPAGQANIAGILARCRNCADQYSRELQRALHHLAPTIYPNPDSSTSTDTTAWTALPVPAVPDDEEE